jgi:hypothetical protein
MEDNYISIILVLIVIVLLCFLAYYGVKAWSSPDQKEYMTPADIPPLSEKQIATICDGRPVSMNSKQFGAYMHNIKGDVIKVYSRLSSVMCKKNLLPILEKIRTALTRETTLSAGQDTRFCKSIRDFMSDASKRNEINEASRHMASELSRSDSELNDELVTLFDDIILNLDAVMHVVANNICDAGNRINLDYINSAIDELSKVCDIESQSEFISPTLDWVERKATRALTGGREQSHTPRKSRVPGRGTRAISAGSKPDEIEVIRAPQFAPPKSLPPLMRQIARGDEGFTDTGLFDEDYVFHMIPRDPHNNSPTLRKVFRGSAEMDRSNCVY